MNDHPPADLTAAERTNQVVAQLVEVNNNLTRIGVALEALLVVVITPDVADKNPSRLPEAWL